MSDDETTDLEPADAIRMMVDQVFHEFGPQYSPEMREAVERMLASVPLDGEADKYTAGIARVIMVASMINAAIIPILELFGTDTVSVLLEDMAGRYKNFGKSHTTH